MKIHRKIFFLIFLLLVCVSAYAQYPVRLHSHNDYNNMVPFYTTYSQMMESIECDMFLVGDELLVGHDRKDLKPDRTFEKLYLDPVLDCYKANGGKAWPGSDERLQLLLEDKNRNPEPFIKALVKRLSKYPEVFDPKVNPYAARIVLTGVEVPDEDALKDIPEYILFDGEYGVEYSDGQLERIYMISTEFGKLAKWNGKGKLIRSDEAEVKECIEKVHSLGKPIRFWGAPDCPTAWNTLYRFGVDFVGTDNVVKCADFFSDWENKNYEITPDKRAATGMVTKTDRLDKTTHGFKGFENDKLLLSRPVATYMPSYRNDGRHGRIKNVILMIGDGMGLVQIDAANKVNGGLSLLNMKYIGLFDNRSRDAFTTDSAGAGSSLATGESNSNRHISISDDGVPYPSLTDFFSERGYACGVVTLGNVVDATPAAFYGHNVERDDADALTKDLLDGKVDLLAGSGINQFTHRDDGFDIISALEGAGYDFIRDVGDINGTDKKVICIDEAMEAAADTTNIGLLAETTKAAVDKLSSDSKGFFLMVEGAKIDYAGHSNCLPGSIVETLSFDMAVQEALKFADSNGETLVIVTADHETGGLTLVDGDLETGHLTARYTTNDHTPVMIPVFAYGPYADRFIGKYQIYDLPNKIKEIFKK
jgi:alkaline phosphatase